MSKLLESDSLNVILDFLKAKVDGVTKIGVTGSYATQTHTEKSDLDIVVDIAYENIPQFWSVAEEVKSLLIDEYMLPVDFIFLKDVQRKIELLPASYCDEVERDMYINLIEKTVWR